jgi:ribulose-bisphosphate carboxylase large chain
LWESHNLEARRERSMERIIAVYRVRSDGASIEARAHAIALEQCVELPRGAALAGIASEVQDISELAPALFEVRIGLAVATASNDAGQLLNMLFGNASLQEDVTLWDAAFPTALAEQFGGPNYGISGLRKICGAGARALTCAAIRPRGLPPEELGALAGKLAAGGIDFIKDDHGLADQSFSRFAERVRACAGEVCHASDDTGLLTSYVPNISGDFNLAAAQIGLAMEEGLEAVMTAPMILGLSNFNRLVRDFPGMAFFAHPAMAGSARIAPPLLLAKLFRMFGADVTIFPDHATPYGYSAETCAAIAEEARRPWPALKRAMPCPAGAITVDSAPGVLDFYGPDTMLLTSGALLQAGDRLTAEAVAFQSRVARYFEGRPATG